MLIVTFDIFLNAIINFKNISNPIVSSFNYTFISKKSLILKIVGILYKLKHIIIRLKALNTSTVFVISNFFK